MKLIDGFQEKSTHGQLKATTIIAVIAEGPYRPILPCARPSGGNSGGNPPREAFLMIIDSDASESEMVLEFLRAEVGSLIGQDPDLSDAHDNSKRALVLDCLRGYSRRIWLFSKFPTDTAWKRVKLTPEDFPSLRYVRSSPWRQLAGDDLSVVTGAKRIMDGTFDRTYPEIARRVPKIEAIARAIHNGADLPPVILATAGSEQVVVEGNHRVTGFVMARPDRPMLALCGSSPSMVEWSQQAWS